MTSGGFVVTWTDGPGPYGDSSGSAILAQAFDLSGNKIGMPFLVNTQTVGYQAHPVLTYCSSSRLE